MAEKVICLYSGGKKSIACLLAILNDPEYNDFIIQVHYVHLIDYRNEFMATLEKVKNSLSYFQSKFPERFIVSENQVNFSCLPERSILPNPIDICLFIARQVVTSDDVLRQIIMGFTHDDLSDAMLCRKLENFFGFKKEGSNIMQQTRVVLPLQNMTVDQIILDL